MIRAPNLGPANLKHLGHAGTNSEIGRRASIVRNDIVINLVGLGGGSSSLINGDNHLGTGAVCVT